MLFSLWQARVHAAARAQRLVAHRRPVAKTEPGVAAASDALYGFS
jgi:hypothetical protein